MNDAMDQQKVPFFKGIESLSKFYNLKYRSNKQHIYTKHIYININKLALNFNTIK